ncbi:kinesin motor domain-containing protein, partial [Cardiosporidium cionae]
IVSRLSCLVISTTMQPRVVVQCIDEPQSVGSTPINSGSKRNAGKPDLSQLGDSQLLSTWANNKDFMLDEVKKAGLVEAMPLGSNPTPSLSTICSVEDPTAQRPSVATQSNKPTKNSNFSPGTDRQMCYTTREKYSTSFTFKEANKHIKGQKDSLEEKSGAVVGTPCHFESGKHRATQQTGKNNDNVEYGATSRFTRTSKASNGKNRNENSVKEPLNKFPSSYSRHQQIRESSISSSERMHMRSASEGRGAISFIQTFVRLRPLQKNEVGKESTFYVQGGSRIAIPGNGKNRHKMTFDVDHIFTPATTQSDVWDSIKSCVDKLLSGYNCTILAHGQTGTGKTFTMLGPEIMEACAGCELPESKRGDNFCDDWQRGGDAAAEFMHHMRSPTFYKRAKHRFDWAMRSLERILESRDRGIIPRVCEEIFERIQNGTQRNNKGIRVFVSYVQLYNEKVLDLLQPLTKMTSKFAYNSRDFSYHLSLQSHDEDTTSLTIYKDPAKEKSVVVQGLQVFEVKSCKEMLQLLFEGTFNRAYRSTKQNDMSSRSHTIFQIEIQQNLNAQYGIRNVSHFNLVDLAGSEKSKLMNQPGRSHVAEMGAINKSLSTLALCINQLSKGETLVSYRNSNLTRLLQESLGGNCFTLFICTLSPSILSHRETATTLRLAARAKNVPNFEKLIEGESATRKIRNLKKEVNYLRGLLKENRCEVSKLDGSNEYLPARGITNMDKKETNGRGRGRLSIMLRSLSAPYDSKPNQPTKIVKQEAQLKNGKWSNSREALCNREEKKGSECSKVKPAYYGEKKEETFPNRQAITQRSPCNYGAKPNQNGGSTRRSSSALQHDATASKKPNKTKFPCRVLYMQHNAAAQNERPTHDKRPKYRYLSNSIKSSASCDVNKNERSSNSIAPSRTNSTTSILNGNSSLLTKLSTTKAIYPELVDGNTPKRHDSLYSLSKLNTKKKTSASLDGKEAAEVEQKIRPSRCRVCSDSLRIRGKIELSRARDQPYRTPASHSGNSGLSISKDAFSSSTRVKEIPDIGHGFRKYFKPQDQISSGLVVEHASKNILLPQTEAQNYKLPNFQALTRNTNPSPLITKYFRNGFPNGWISNGQANGSMRLQMTDQNSVYQAIPRTSNNMPPRVYSSNLLMQGKEASNGYFNPPIAGYVKNGALTTAKTFRNGSAMRRMHSPNIVVNSPGANIPPHPLTVRPAMFHYPQQPFSPLRASEINPGQQTYVGGVEVNNVLQHITRQQQHMDRPYSRILLSSSYNEKEEKAGRIPKVGTFWNAPFNGKPAMY